VSPILFISDLHLCAARADVAQRFLRFLAGEARAAGALYILGDLFEYWAGDDDLGEPFNQEICAGLRRLTDAGTPIFFMAGNRDFLVGADFAAASGARLLAEPLLAEISGTPTLLVHGDSLCTDDIDYQRFRAQVRDPEWQAAFLNQPLAARRTQIEALRRLSDQEKRKKTMEITDVNDAAVAALVRAQGWPPRLIHGHTHRPARHLLDVDGHPCERWVLAAWEDSPSYLLVDRGGCRPVNLD
jgi:UDP-2,3-diacylglucosamine hydrolase